jgi:UDP-N-acetylmuramate: L-alanyl-gamma-D-glutamyl-meso-diaminopimelate ligase
VIAPVFHARRLTPETVLDREALARRFAGAGKPAFAPESIAEIPEILRLHARPGDVLILMSSGSFGGLPATLLDAL